MNELIQENNQSADDFMNDLKKSQSNEIKETDEWYYADRRFTTNSHLSKLNEGGPLGLLHSFDHPEPEKDYHIWGKAFHCSILEPNEFDKRFWALDDTEIYQDLLKKKFTSPRSTKEYKIWKAGAEQENQGKTAIMISDYNDIMRTRDKVLSISHVTDLLKYTVKEKIYHSNILGVEVKCKPDAFMPKEFGIELKSMRECPTPENFLKNLKGYSWDRQMAFYRDILSVPQYWFIACEKENPNTVAIYEITDQHYQNGKKKYYELLNQYKNWFVTNKIQAEDNRKKFYYFGMI